MFLTAEPFDSMRALAFKFLAHASESYRVFLKLKEMEGKMYRRYFPAKLESWCCELERDKQLECGFRFT